jgi:hypothetical protein
MVPQPVLAVLLLFPCSKNYEHFKAEEEARLTKLEQNISPKVYFIKQTIQNACGMIALLHSIANNEKIVGMLGYMTYLCDRHNFLIGCPTTDKCNFPHRARYTSKIHP